MERAEGAASVAQSLGAITKAWRMGTGPAFGCAPSIMAAVPLLVNHPSWHSWAMSHASVHMRDVVWEYARSLSATTSRQGFLLLHDCVLLHR